EPGFVTKCVLCPQHTSLRVVRSARDDVLARLFTGYITIAAWVILPAIGGRAYSVYNGRHLTTQTLVAEPAFVTKCFLRPQLMPLRFVSCARYDVLVMLFTWDITVAARVILSAFSGRAYSVDDGLDLTAETVVAEPGFVTKCVLCPQYPSITIM